MRRHTDIENRQLAGFAFANVGWILSIMCMGLAEWRVWHMNSTSFLEPSLACVGMWKVCLYHNVTNLERPTFCYFYTYDKSFLPDDIRGCQDLLVAASILGLLGQVFIAFAVKKLSTGTLWRNVLCNPFVFSGILNMAAGICIFITVIRNQKSVLNGEGISFPPSFHIHFQPDRQEMGNAMLVAYLAAFLMLLSGLFLLPFKCPVPNQVQPEASEMEDACWHCLGNPDITRKHH